MRVGYRKRDFVFYNFPILIDTRHDTPIEQFKF